MSEPARHWISVSEYLQQEELAETKSEYFNGEVFAMAGGTAEHSQICLNLAYILMGQLENSKCRIHNSDLRVKVPATGLYTYPDLSVVCAEPDFEGSGRTTLLNPVVIIEVLSPSTEAYDRGDKFAHYQRLDSLQEYVLVASDKRRIERYSRLDKGNEWLLTICSDPSGSIELPAVPCTLPLERVYHRIELPSSTTGSRSVPDTP
jgi:Uma2 family endonuclease